MEVTTQESQPLASTPALYGTALSEWDGFVLPVPLDLPTLTFELKSAFLAARADTSRLGNAHSRPWKRNNWTKSTARSESHWTSV